MRKIVILSITALSIILLSTSSYTQTDTELAARIRTIIDSIYVADTLPGITAIVSGPGFEFEYSVGKADISTGRDRKVEDLIRIGSITKTFVATVILQLIDEKKLGLDDPLSKFYPGYPNSENITIRQLLDMTSGIPDYLEDPVVLNSFVKDRTDKYTPKELFDVTMKMTPYFPPGQGWHYSNGNYNILGMLIEKITGNKIEDEITGRIIQPLGLSNTFYPTSPQINGTHSNGYFRDTVSDQLIDVTTLDPSIAWAAGCMVSNLPDLKKYVKALVDGDLISEDLQKERIKFIDVPGASYAKYGLGMFSLEGFMGHNGGLPGFFTTMCYDPALQTIILTSVNIAGFSGSWSDMVFMEIAKAMFPGKDLFKH